MGRLPALRPNVVEKFESIPTPPQPRICMPFFWLSNFWFRKVKREEMVKSPHPGSKGHFVGFGNTIPILTYALQALKVQP